VLQGFQEGVMNRFDIIGRLAVAGLARVVRRLPSRGRQARILAALCLVMAVSEWSLGADAVDKGWVLQHAAVPAGMPSASLSGISCRSSGSCTAVGDYQTGDSQTGDTTAASLAERWNGARWITQSTPDRPGSMQSDLAGVSCASDTACTAVGYEVTDGNVTIPLAEGWNGSGWTVESTPSGPHSSTSNLFGVSCTTFRTCTAVGYYLTDEGTSKVLAEGWNGASWVMEPTPGAAADGSLFDVSCPSASGCIAVGVANSGAPLAEMWNGKQWSRLNPVRQPGAINVTLGSISCLSAANCVAVGSYENAAEVFFPLTQTWNGTTWSIEPAPIPPGATDSYLSALSCGSRRACLAVGGFYGAAGGPRPFAESWNGAKWNLNPQPPPGALQSVSCASPERCTAVGFYFYGARAAAWDGQTWTVQAVPSLAGSTQSYLSAVSCNSAAACTAVGSYWTKDTNVALAESWNNQRWTVQPTPNPPRASTTALAAVSCPSATSCVAVGSTVINNPRQRSLAEVWNGHAWTVELPPSPGPEASLNAVSCPTPTSCVAVGSYQNSAGIGLALTEFWDGSTWAIEPSANPTGEENSSLSGVSCTSATSCMAVGFWSGLNGVDFTLAEAWNGKKWIIEPTPTSTGGALTFLNSVSCSSASICSAVGDADQRPLAEGWNGSSWVLQPTPSLPGVSSLTGVSCATASSCTAVGYAGNNPLAESWNGSSWALQPTPTLAAGGSFAAVSCVLTTQCTGTGEAANNTGTAMPLAERHK
jgi:hypothetical protein